MLCHGLDFDDTHSDSGSHVSTVIAPAALAAAELYGAGGRDALAAIVAGNEVVCRDRHGRTGRASTRRGFHPTAICGVFGATAAVARLAGFDAETTTRALGIAGSMASGIFAYLADGTPTKPIHPGWAAHGGSHRDAARHHGAAGPALGLRGEVRALPRLPRHRAGRDRHRRAARRSRLALGDAADRVQAVPGLPFHARLASARRSDAVDGRTFAPDEIAEVVVTVPEAGVSLVLEPAGEKKAPRSEYEGKFSLQYSVASMLVRGHVGRDGLHRRGDRRPRRARRRGEGVATRRASSPPTRRRSPGGAASSLASGETLERDFPYQKGGPENPMSADEVRAKFRANAALALPSALSQPRSRRRSSRSRSRTT